MRNSILFFAALSAAATIALPTSVSAETYKCSFEEKRKNGGWIPEIVVLDIDAKNKLATVYDPLIAHFIGKPIRAKIATDNAARTTFTWRVKATTDSLNQFANMDYRLTVQKADRSSTISGQAIGYDGPYTARGNCELAK